MLVYCPVIIWDRHVSHCVILSQAQLLLYNGKAYSIVLENTNLSLKQHIQQGYSVLSVHWDTFFCHIYECNEVVLERNFTLSLWKPHTLLKYIVPYQWDLARDPDISMHLHDVMWRIFRVQRFLRKHLQARIIEKKLALCMASHPRLGANSLLSQMNNDFFRLFFLD